MYSQDNKGLFPDKNGAMGLEMLRSGGYLENPHMYACPSTAIEGRDMEKLTEETVSYVYVGGYNSNTPPDTAIAYDKTKNHYKFGNILFADGHIAGYSGANWMNSGKDEGIVFKRPISEVIGGSR